MIAKEPDLVNTGITTMAKAQITTPDGIIVKLDGTAEEIATLMGKLRSPTKAEQKPTPGAKNRKKSSQKVQLVDLIDALIDGGFFKTPRDLGAVRSALAEIGHHYPITTLSPAMLRKVRKRSLRRLKQDKRWVYTGSNK